MVSFSINNSKFKEKSINGRRSVTKWNESFANIMFRVKTLLKTTSEISNHENFYFINIKYNKLPPKTKRFIFKEKYLNIEDIPQRGIKTAIEDNEVKYIISYQLSKVQFALIISMMKDIIMLASAPKEISENIFNEFSEEQKVKIKTLAHIEDISEIKNDEIESPKIVRLFKMYENTKEMLNNIGVDSEKLDINTYVITLTPEEFLLINENIPWIISDILENGVYKVDSFDFDSYADIIIPDKPVSGVVGVFDSGFHPYPGMEKYVLDNVDVREHGLFSSKGHGTMVSSLIIANDILNPNDKDGYGLFNIKHFEALEPISDDGDSTVGFNHLAKQIEKAVRENSTIKVWNLSLGANKTPWTLNVSALGMKIDWIAAKYDVLFVVASGNEREKLQGESLNTPGDSLNSLTVGSVMPFNIRKTKTLPSDYSSYGSILHFEKPEVSEFGGKKNISGYLLNSIDENGVINNIEGTSFSTPKVSRIAAFLVNKGYTPLEAKAKIISMASKETESTKSSSFGFLEPKEDEALNIKTEINISNTKANYLDLAIPKNTMKIIIAVSTLVKPVPSLGEEYSLSNIELSLVQYNDNVKHPERVKGMRKSFKLSGKTPKFKTEKHRRYYDGKYFSSKKVEYILSDSVMIDDFKTALRIRKQDLFTFVEGGSPSVKVGIVVSFLGDIDIDEFKTINTEIIDIHENVYT